VTHSNLKTSKSVSGFAILLGVVAGLMASFSSSRHQTPDGFLNNLMDAIMWGCVYWGVLLVCKFSLAKIDFFNNFYGLIGIKGALLGFAVCVITYLIMIFLVSIF